MFAAQSYALMRRKLGRYASARLSSLVWDLLRPEHILCIACPSTHFLRLVNHLPTTVYAAPYPRLLRPTIEASPLQRLTAPPALTTIMHGLLWLSFLGSGAHAISRNPSFPTSDFSTEIPCLYQSKCTKWVTRSPSIPNSRPLP